MVYIYISIYIDIFIYLLQSFSITSSLSDVQRDENDVEPGRVEFYKISHCTDENWLSLEAEALHVRIKLFHYLDSIIYDSFSLLIIH